MGITSGIVLYAVIWFMTFFVVLPFRVTTQGDAGEVVPGTHAGAPEVHNLRRKALITTGLAAVIWSVVAALILFAEIDVNSFNLQGYLQK